MERILFHRRVGTKIFATLMVVAVFALAATGAALIGLSGRTLRVNIAQRNLQIARRAANEIGMYLDHALRELRALAEALMPVRDPWLQDALVENLSTVFGRFTTISLLDSRGNAICSSLLDRREEPPVDVEALNAALSGGVYLSPVRLSPESLPYMTVALPAGVSGKGRRALVAELALRDIWALVDDISFGEKGEALLLSRDGILIAHPDKTRVIREAGAASGLCEPSSRSEGRVSVSRDPREVSMLVACAPVPSLGWRVVVQQPLAEAYLPLRQVVTYSLLILAAVLATAVLANLILVSRLMAPLGLLLAGTRRIGGGELGHRIPVISRDEIGRLSAAFNSMVEQLQSRSLRLKESEERYRLMAESVEDIIFSLDKKGRLLFINRRGVTVSGFPLDRLLGRPGLELLCERSREESEKKLAECLRRGFHGGLELEVELCPREGESKILEVKLVRVFSSSGKLEFHGVARDITQRKEAERRLLSYQEQLRSLASQLSLVEARERKRIAADLHDRIGQALALIKIRLGERGGELADTLKLIDRTIRDTHALIFDLSSPLLYEVGLKAALEQLVEQFQEEHGIRIRFEDDERPKPLGGDVSVLLFQAVKELLVNAVKHARADCVHVSLSRSGDEVRITVSDDGIGFDAAEAAFRPDRRGGFGLFSIRERLQVLGGALHLDSQPRRGTRASLAVKLDNNRIRGGNQ